MMTPGAGHTHLTRPELKQLVHRPDVVEEHDVAAADPRLLVFLKVTPPLLSPSDL